MTTETKVKTGMAWDFRKQSDGSIEVHDARRLRSIIRKDAGGWRLDTFTSTGQFGGCYSFKTLAEAKTFATNEKIFKPY